MGTTTKRILLVDDQPRNLLALAALLEPLGHELFRATDGSAALAAFERERPDLVLLDLVMPDVGGLEVLSSIRACPVGGDVPVVLLTAHSDRERRLEGLRAGADDFLEKPLDEAILLARVRSLLALQASRDELKSKVTALSAAQREQRELTEFVVHDLRNPLTVLSGNVAMAAGELLPSQTHLKEMLDDATAASFRLGHMIDDLLAISRLETATFPLRIERVPVSSLLRAVSQGYAPHLAERGLTLVPPTDVDVEVDADQGLLRRVVENLLDNALRYTPRAGRIGLELRLSEGAEILVSNDGQPIPPADADAIFEKFRRGRGEAGGMGNAGLGLYFCKRALAAHGGDIRVERSAEWPITFAIRLPLRAAEAGALRH